MPSDDPASIALTGDDSNVLKTQYRRLRHEVEAAGGSWNPLHGDVHLGNLVLDERGPIWVDFEDACLGPREYDICGLPSNAWPLFGEADQTLVRICSDPKSVCAAAWCSADISRSAEVREAANYHLRRSREMAR